MTRTLLILGLLLLGPLAARAQGPRALLRGPRPSPLFALRARPPGTAVGDTAAREIAPTEWRRGLLIGAGVGGVALGFVGYALCHDLTETHDSCLGTTLGGAVLGGVMGGVTGALIGGAFRRAAPHDSLASSP